MNRAQEILLQMLDEVNAVCKENGLNLFLFSNTAFSAYCSGEFETGRNEINVMMLWKDAVAFQRIIEEKKPEGRMVESLFSNPDLGNVSFRYVNTGTTYINKKSVIRARALGLSVNIWPLFSEECEVMPETGSHRNIIGKVRYRLFEKKSAQRKKRLISEMDKRMEKLHRGKSLGSKSEALLESLNGLQVTASLGDTLYFRRFSTLNKSVFPKGLFTKTMDVQFEGRTFRIPADLDGFFGAQFRDWKNKELNTDTRIPRFEILDEDLPYSKYLQYLRENDMEELLDKRMIFPTGRVLGGYNDIVDDAWNKVLRTAARINMWDQYMPLKPQIMELYRQEKWDELQELLADYDEAMKEMDRLGMTVYFDEDIFNVYCEILERNGEKDAKARRLALVPEEHLKPVQLKY